MLIRLNEEGYLLLQEFLQGKEGAALELCGHIARLNLGISPRFDRYLDEQSADSVMYGVAGIRPVSTQFGPQLAEYCLVEVDSEENCLLNEAFEYFFSGNLKMAARRAINYVRQLSI